MHAWLVGSPSFGTSDQIFPWTGINILISSIGFNTCLLYTGIRPKERWVIGFLMITWRGEKIWGIVYLLLPSVDHHHLPFHRWKKTKETQKTKEERGNIKKTKETSKFLPYPPNFVEEESKTRKKKTQQIQI